MRPSSPLLDSVRDLFEGQDRLATDFGRALYLPPAIPGPTPGGGGGVICQPPPNASLFDVTFVVGQGKVKTRLYGVRAILGVRSR